MRPSKKSKPMTVVDDGPREINPKEDRFVVITESGSEWGRFPIVERSHDAIRRAGSMRCAVVSLSSGAIISTFSHINSSPVKMALINAAIKRIMGDVTLGVNTSLIGQNDENNSSENGSYKQEQNQDLGVQAKRPFQIYNYSGRQAGRSRKLNGSSN